MATQPTNIKIGVSVDQNSIKVTSAALRQFQTQENTRQRMTQRQALALQVAATKAEAKENEARAKSATAVAGVKAREAAKTLKVEQATAAAQTKLAAGVAAAQAKAATATTRETIRQTNLQSAQAKKLADEAARLAEKTMQVRNRNVDAEAKHAYLTQQKSKTEYIAYLKAEEQAAGASYQRRNQLIQQRERLERQGRPSVFGAGLSAAGSAVSVLGSAAAIKRTYDEINNLTTKASDLVEARDKNRRIFGEAGKEIEEWSKRTANAIGLSQTKSIEAASTIGNLLHAGGVTGQAGVTLSRRLVERGADIGSLNNIDPNDVADKIKSGLAGQVRPLREVGIFLSEARVKAEAFAQGYAKPIKDGPKIERAHRSVEIAVARLAEAQKKYGDGSIETASARNTLSAAESRLEKATKGSSGELSEAAKIQARASIIFKDTAIQEKNFADTKDEVANATRREKAQLEDLEANIGTKFLPLRKQVLGVLNDWLDKFNSLDENTKGLATNILAIGGIAVPLAVGVGNIVAQLLRIKTAYQEIKTAQALANLGGAGNPYAGAAASAGGGFAGTAAGRFILGGGGGILGHIGYGGVGLNAGSGAGYTGVGSVLPGLVGGSILAAPFAGLGYGLSAINSEDEVTRNNDINDTERSPAFQAAAQQLSETRDRIAELRTTIKKLGANASSAQKYIKELNDAKTVEAQLQKTYISEYAKWSKATKQASTDTSSNTTPAAWNAFLAKAAQDKANAKTGTGDPGNKAVPSLYFGAARNAANRKADAAQKKAEREAARIEKDSDSIVWNWGKFLQKVADARVKDAKETAELNSQADTLRAQAVKAIEETQLATAKAVLDSVPDAEDFAALTKNGQSVDAVKIDLRAKIVEAETLIQAHIEAIYNAEIDRLEAEYSQKSARQAGDSDAKAAARQSAAFERLSKGQSEAGRVRNAAIIGLDKQGEAARREVEQGADRQYEEARKQVTEAMQSKAKFLDAENKTLSRELKYAEENADFEKQTQLVNQRMRNEIDQASQTFYEAFLSGDADKIAQANQEYIDAADKAAEALRQIAIDTHEPAAMREQARIERIRQLDGRARGQGRFITDKDGFTYDTKNANGQTGKARDLRRVDGAAIEAAATLTDAAKRNGGEFLKSLFTGEGSRDALKNFGKNLGRDFADTGAQFLQRKLIDGPVEKLFDSFTDKIESAFSKGGKEAAGNIAGAALLLSNAANFLGKNGKKKQRNSLLGAAIGFGLGSILPGVGNLEGAGLGASLLSGFAGGGTPPLGRAVMVGEYGPELAVFNQRAQIIPAEQSAQMVARGANGTAGGGISNTFGAPLVYMNVGQINDRADADHMMRLVTDKLDDGLVMGGIR